MTFTARPYQTTTVNSLHASWAAGKRAPLVVAPTGAGKTEIAKLVLEPYRAPMALVHTDVLFEQTARRAKNVRPYTPQSLIATGPAAERRWAGIARHDCCWVDEAHHYLRSWKTVLDRIAAMGIPVFGVTATPVRADGTPLGDCFDDLIVAAKYSELLRDGYLVKCDVERSLISRNAQKKEKVRPDGVAAYMKHGKRADGSWRPGIHFETTIEACELACRRYNEAGIRAALVCKDTDTATRRKLFTAYTCGELDMLCSPTALAEGFDSPRAEVCVLRRMVDHLGDYMQRCGRVLRPFPGKERALIIDICNASVKHGLPTDDRVFSLTGAGMASLPPPEEEKDEEEVELLVPAGYKTVESNYILIRDTLLSRYRDLQSQAADFGYKQGWVWHRFTEATSISPPRMFEAKFQSTCLHCRKRLKLGELMFWGGTKQVFHEECWFASLDGEKLTAASAALEHEQEWKPSRRNSFDACADEARGRPYSAPVGVEDDIPF